MGIYENIGVKPIINLAGPVTRFGGALMRSEVVEAMCEAARESVRLDELEAAASKVIAEITGAEAGYVTSGAAASMTLGTAACLTGLDVARMNRLPDTSGMPNEVLMSHHQISGYTRSVQAAGAKLVAVGIPNDTTPPTEVYTTKAWEFEAAITERTVAIAYAYDPGSTPPLEEVIEIAHKYNLPVLVDAAAQIPPVENLRKFTSMGADLVAISGGKGIRGPQNSGILCGRRDLIAAAALQHLDMAGIEFDKWDPPNTLIPKERLKGIPLHGIGRGMKVSKETIVGVIVALQLMTTEKMKQDLERQRTLLGQIARCLQTVHGLEVHWIKSVSGIGDRLQLNLGPKAVAVSNRLKNGSPRIYVGEEHISKGILIVDALNLDEELTNIVTKCLYTAIIEESR